MRRYRGADKPPGLTLSPPPYSRHSTSRSNGSTRQSTGMNMPRLPLSSATTPPKPDNEHGMMRGLVSTSVPFLDPRTKKPMIPPAGRSIPKLKMGDLASTLAPLVESQMEQQNYGKSRAKNAVSDKRVADAMKEVTGTKDLLESFDDAVKVPDMSAINSKVLQLRKGVGPQSNHPPKISSRLGNAPNSKAKAGSTGKLNVAKVSPKNEEQNIRRLMGHLKDKYLGDMESQLGLAIERRPKSFLQGETSNSSYNGMSGKDSVLEVGIPKPSTNASEITNRIDKVVREWATESQKINSTMKVPVSSKQQHHSVGSINKVNNVAWQKTAKSINDMQSAGKDKRKSNSNDMDSNAAASGRNKNLAKISTAFRKSLDPISKRDVRELIGFPEEDHVEKLEQEHDERRRAHESVFNNAVTSNSTSYPQDLNGNNGNMKSGKRMQVDVNGNPESIPTDQNRRKSNQIRSQHNSFAKSIAKGNDHEVYSIIKEHMEYETSGGAPKLTTPSTREPAVVTRNSSSVLRADAAGKALLKYSDSHKKLQSVVNSFTEKVNISSKKWLGPTAAVKTTGSGDSEEESDVSTPKEKLPLKLSTVSNVATINSRRRNSSEVSTTLSRSMKTIDRASSVAQRLGTLMSRVALRNESYDYTQQQKEKELQQQTISLSTANDDSSASLAAAQNSIRALSVPSSLSSQYDEKKRQNPYETPLHLTNSRGKMERPNVPPGVSKLDSSRFGKYVDDMKKVAEKAAESFEKFKERQVKHDGDLVSFSEDEEDASEHRYKGSGEAAAIAAAAAEISAIQEQEKKRKAQLQQMSLQQKRSAQRSSPRTQANQSDAGTGTSPRETMELFSQINRSTGSGPDKLNSNNNASTDPEQFKFVPDMSYTDQLMLHKLRKLKEQEGWSNSSLSRQIDAANETVVGDVPLPDHREIESIIKRATNLSLPGEAERASMGPISLNAILRSRLSGKSKK